MLSGITPSLNILGNILVYDDDDGDHIFACHLHPCYLLVDPNAVVEQLSWPALAREVLDSDSSCISNTEVPSHFVVQLQELEPKKQAVQAFSEEEVALGKSGNMTLCCSEPKTQPAPATETTEVTCPYLKNQASAQEAPKVDPEDLENSFLEKMDQLKEGRQILRLADYYRKMGDRTAAGMLYLRVQSLCPGSSLDRRAGARLRMMWAEGTEAAGAEQETAPPETEPAQSENQPPRNDTAKRVGQLLTACHKAFMAGEYFRAAELAEKALQIDAACVQAHPLVYKLNLLKQVQDKVSSLLPTLDPMGSKQTPPARAAEPIHIQAEEEPHIEGLPPADVEESLRHALPPIDSGVVQTLEKVLADAADPLSAKLVVLAEDQASGETQEDVSGAWFSGLPPVSIPSLLNEGENAEAARAEEEAEDSPPRGPQPELNGVLHEVLEAVRDRASVDIDSSRADGLRIQCELEVGGMEFKVVWGESGQRYAVVRLLPEACPDLRAVQRAHDDMIIDWIQSLSGNGDYSLNNASEEPDYIDLVDELEDADSSEIDS
jgi:hypothetical protein